MNKIYYIIVVFLFASCNGENAPDCFQKTGTISREVVELPDFSKITIFENVSVILKQGDASKVEIETGKNLRKEVTAMVEGDRLIIRDDNNCNFVRDYGVTKIYITSPNITEIRSGTSWSVESDGVLLYPNMVLISEDHTNPETKSVTGEFNLDLEISNLRIVVNGSSYFNLRGTVDNLNVVMASGNSRIDAQHLITKKVTLNHRGTNDLLINPQESISGVIRSTGNVVSYNRPEDINVDEIYRGKLIFKEE